MKTIIFISLICFIGQINNYSQTKQDAIKELFKLTKQDSIVDKTFNTMAQPMLNQIQGQMKDSASMARSREIMNYSIQMIKEITKRLINEDMVNIYDKHFTQNEINDFISFYKTTSGQKFIKETPEISKDLIMIWMQKYQPEMMKSMKSKMDEMKVNTQK